MALPASRSRATTVQAGIFAGMKVAHLPNGAIGLLPVFRGRGGRRWVRQRQAGLVAQGGKARIMPVGEDEGGVEEFGKIRVPLRPGALQPVEHVVDLIAQRVNV